MAEKAKTIVLAFSGMIVYTALYLAFGYMFAEPLYAKLAACIVGIIVGGLYLKTVIGCPKHDFSISQKFVGILCASVILFVVASFFTTSYALTSGLQDAVYTASIAAKTSLTTGQQALSLFVSIVLMPIAEELIFRGFMYGQLAAINKLMAIAFSSIFFALWHGTLIHIYPALFGGVLFACAYEKTKRLSVPILAHMSFNALTTLLGLFSYSFITQAAWLVVIANVVCVATVVTLFRTDAQNIAAKPQKPKTRKECLTGVK